jgi:hypothetical protein
MTAGRELPLWWAKPGHEAREFRDRERRDNSVERHEGWPGALKHIRINAVRAIPRLALDLAETCAPNLVPVEDIQAREAAVALAQDEPPAVVQLVALAASVGR